MLYYQKRVKVYLNGGPSEKAKLCWASNLEELVEEAKKKLDLNKPIRCFFTSDGKLVILKALEKTYCTLKLISNYLR